MDGEPSTVVTVARLGLRLANRHMRPYGSPRSRHDFTQPQLMVCLILRAYWKATYRDVVDQLKASWELRDAMGLKKAPNYSTLCKFAARPGVLEVLDGMLASLAAEVETLDSSDCREAAMDATGLETTSASAHYLARSGRKQRRYVKVSVVVLLNSLIPGAMAMDTGPSNDKRSARRLLPKAREAIHPDRLYADAGYDAEWIHRFCHEDWKLFSVIKPVRHREGPPGGAYRSQMTERTLKKLNYGRRWLVESYMAGLKRTTGSRLSACSEPARNVEAGMKVMAYALRR
jgi:transposase